MSALAAFFLGACAAYLLFLIVVAIGDSKGCPFCTGYVDGVTFWARWLPKRWRP